MKLLHTITTEDCYDSKTVYHSKTNFQSKRLKRRCLEEHRPEPIQLNEITIRSTVNVRTLTTA